MSATEDDTPSGAVNIPASADATPGVLLRNARERAGLSQEDIASKLKLAPRQIAAIETADWNSLPERTFTRGFMRSYARIVGLDPNIVGLDRSPSQPNIGSELKPTPEAIGEVTMEHTRSKTGAARWVVPIVLVAFLAAGVTYFQWGERIGLGALKIGALSTQSSSTKTPPAASNAPVTPLSPGPSTASETVAATTLSPTSSGSVIAPAVAPDTKDSVPTATTLLMPPVEPAVASLPAGPDEKRITITFKGKSWTEVRSKGDVIYSEASLPGTKEFNGKLPLSFIVGNASNVVLNIDGKPYDMSSITRNDVARFRIE